ncbi:unnamed protein product [Triticum turgidum subsp. durum]|uniref:Uncharacterized protein n=2 Tax=Triticum TaxID=4564 RepID=A0A9R1RYW4_TRITD|nr:unnamed protein product [Triticum aestivum]VAH74718.1 unnamed protein product [Triticum turgidum subsp. durum]
MEVRFPLILSFSSPQAAPNPLGLDLAGRVQAGKESVARLMRELEGVGLLVERVRGVPAKFIKLSAPMGILGRAAFEMQMKKLTYISNSTNAPSV